jgi:anaerobic magnesium-protoporphyrin IX monomethyl ester cyclase
MRIVFVALGQHYLAIEYFSASLKKNGHEVHLVFDPKLFNDAELVSPFLEKVFSYKEEVIKQVTNLAPDLVCFTVVTDYYSYAVSLAKEIKSRINTFILFGGIHVTSVPEICIKNPYIDLICIGEGDDAIVELANSYHKGKFKKDIKNIWFKSNNKIIKNPIRPPKKDLDSLPFPDHDLYYSVFSGFRGGYYTITSRYCLFGCTYCHNNFMKKLYKNDFALRKRSVDNVIEELVIAKRKYRPKAIRFHDDIFAFDKKWMREFSEKYKERIDLPFSCFGHAYFIDDEMAKLLKNAGCHEIQFGVQTLYKKTQKEILKRYIPPSRIDKTISILKKYKIQIITDNILGLPNQTQEEIHDLALFYAKNPPTRINIYFLRYYPKTEIIDIAEKKGILNKEDIKKLELAEKVTFFTCGGDTYKKEHSKFLALFSCLPNIPIKRIRIFIVKKRLYRFFLHIDPVFIRAIFRLIYYGKYEIYMNFAKKKYIYYSLRKLGSILVSLPKSIFLKLIPLKNKKRN